MTIELGTTLATSHPLNGKGSERGSANSAAGSWRRPKIVELDGDDGAEARARVESESRIDIAIDFLRRFHPTTPWALASFGPGENEIGPAQTFDPAEEAEARRFIDTLQGRHNIYFTVNRAGAKLSKKASKREIAEVHWLHADVDLSKTLDWADHVAVAAEKAGVLDRLRSYDPPPTVINWSGGGFQAFWRLSEIVRVNGSKELMGPIERRIQRIEKFLGADACHNADRIMRLPGTINVLSLTKIRAGRRSALAEVVEFHEDRICDLEDFPEPEPPQRNSNGQCAHQRASVDGDEIERIRDALGFIQADDYGVYLEICMALKNELGDAGFGVCRDWAMRSVKFDDTEFRRKWASIKPVGGVTIATLFGKARDNGWREVRQVDSRRTDCRGRTTEGGERSSADRAADVKPWPILQSTATHGLIGEIAKLATRESEADPVAVMATTLAWGAAIFGRNRFYRVGDTVHHARLYCALVGASSRARKGTSLGPVQRIFREAENILQSRSTLPFPAGLSLNVAHGLSSGEGLVAEIRDKRDEDDDGAVTDKRLLVVEGEFGSVLRQFERQGNTLSTTLRVAWDGSDLGTMTKNNRDRATQPHICFVGHITNQELNALLSNTDIWNGVANRLLWVAVRRNKVVPFPRPMPDGDVTAIANELARVIECAHSRSHADAELTMSNSAKDYWVACYPEFTQDYPGILGAVTSRAEAQALRLAMAYAQYDGAPRIELQHLEAALTFWRYSFDSAGYIFKGAEIDPTAQRIMGALATGPKTQTDIVDLFGRNLPKKRIEGVLSDLQERGRITLTFEETGGRPRKVWHLVS